MLCLMRRVGERVTLQMTKEELEALLAREGKLEMEVVVTKVVGSQTHIGFDAPKEVNIVRSEIIDRE